MSERHESDCALDSEHAKQQDIQTPDQEDSEVFSPRDYQEGFWGN